MEMSENMEKICPECQEKLFPTEDIVICSKCNTPHHKHCWQRHGGCAVQGCADHTQPITAIHCTQCGAANNGAASFCFKCGTRLIGSVPQKQEESTEIAAPAANQRGSQYDYLYRQHNTASPTANGEMEQMLGPNSDYYMRKFREINEKNSEASWNWAAFLFSPFWLIYRKMYSYAAIVFGIEIVLDILNSFNSILIQLVSLGVSVAVGIFANGFYQNFLSPKVSAMKNLSEEQKKQYILREGGVNAPATAVLVFAYYAVYVLLGRLF